MENVMNTDSHGALELEHERTPAPPSSSSAAVCASKKSRRVKIHQIYHWHVIPSTLILQFM